MLNRYRVGPVGTDCTAPYSVKLGREHTVKEFVDLVLSETDEWGHIGVERPGHIFGEPNCDYKHGQLLNGLPEEILDKKITSVRANGGYSRMDYLLTIKED